MRRVLSRSLGTVSAVGVLVVALAAGCSDRTPGVATPGDAGDHSPGSASQTTEPPQTGPPSSEMPTVEVPAPPRELSLEGLEDACTLLTDGQKAELQIDDFRSGTVDSGPYRDMKNCHIDVNTEPFYGYYIMAITDEGVDQWLTGNRNVDAELTSIGGYPAAKFKTMGTEDVDCTISIGVAAGQQLWVEMTPLSDFKQDQICQASEQAAEMALATLQTLR